MAMKENARLVLDYVMTHEDENVTVNDISEATGVPARSVNGIVTMAFQKKGFMVREEAEVENDEGKTVKVKYIKMTPEGRAHDYDAEPEKE